MRLLAAFLQLRASIHDTCGCVGPPLGPAAALWDKAADLRNSALENENCTALEASLAALNTTTASPAASVGKRKQYMCSHCKMPKKGHVCGKKVTQPKKRKGSTVWAALKRMRK